MNGASQAPLATVFRRRVRVGFEARYEEWLAGIARAAARSPGNQGTTILRPSEEAGEYVAITQFDSAESLGAWLESTDRASWLSRLEAIDVCRENVVTLAGMERWLTLPPGRPDLPPRYKTAALVLLGLYPLLLVLDVVLGPRLAELPRPVGLLASLLVSVSIMVGFVLPWLTRVFGGWLHPRERPSVRRAELAEREDGDRSGRPSNRAELPHAAAQPADRAGAPRERGSHP